MCFSMASWWCVFQYGILVVCVSVWHPGVVCFSMASWCCVFQYGILVVCGCHTETHTTRMPYWNTHHQDAILKHTPWCYTKTYIMTPHWSTQDHAWNHTETHNTILKHTPWWHTETHNTMIAHWNTQFQPNTQYSQYQSNISLWKEN